MKARLVRTKTSGQSLPIIALVIVVLIGMVALALDVGNTYAEQRSTVRASNAAALTGMGKVIGGSQDQDVYQAIVKSLQSNNIRVANRGVPPQSGERLLQAMYLDAKGNWLADVGDIGAGAPPSGAKYLQVKVTGKVDTFFARVVGQQTLPVGADAYASRGPCTSGVFPIVIRQDYLNENGFVAPGDPDQMQYYKTYSDANYRNKTQRRLYLKDNSNLNGGFSYLRWLSDPSTANQTGLAAGLTGDGNLDEGFQEAPWQNNNSLGLNAPPGYPELPGQLSPGDWVWANSGLSNANGGGPNSGTATQLNWHIQNHTVMYLPIYDTNSGQGNTAAYHIKRLAAFMLVGYGHQGGQGKGWYYDMVYIGKAADCPMVTTPPPPDTETPDIAGSVWFRPRSKVVPQTRPPVLYEIILDISGSMSWNFAGQTGSRSNPTQCTGVVFTNPCNGGWSPTSERRIRIAKDAIKGFIGNMAANDTMKIVTFNGSLNGGYSNQRAVNDLTKVLPSTGWSSDQTALKNAIETISNDTNGTTPSATGIARANQEMASAPTKDPVSGQTYKRVVIFLTDGVANVRRDGRPEVYTGNCLQGSSEIAACNFGYTNTNPPVAKPVTAMGIEASSLKQLATIYVIAMAGVDETGLKDVASASNYPFFSSAESGAELQGIFANIATNVKSGTCVPTDGIRFINKIQEENVGDVPPPSGPVSYPTVGYVYLYDQNGSALPNGRGKAPIQIDAETGALTYRFNDLPTGTYTMRAFVGYRGADDLSRIYDLIYDPNTGSSATTTSFTLQPPNGLGTVVSMPPTYLDMQGSVCPNP